jgi:hypothetical protein
MADLASCDAARRDRPVDGCGSPYLTWHHFPPFADVGAHDPERTIAMCWGHHAQADGGAWSHDELRR